MGNGSKGEIKTVREIGRSGQSKKKRNESKRKAK